MYSKPALIAYTEQMKTTLYLDKDLLQKAQNLTGISDATQIVHAALRTLVQREASKRLAQLGGTEPQLRDVPRRRM
jgi:Arc/MetJ family transcription regulator